MKRITMKRSFVISIVTVILFVIPVQAREDFVRPAVGDVSATSEGAERAIVTEAGGVQLFDGKGDVMTGFPWFFDTETVIGSPLLADITGDGLKEIILTARNGTSQYSVKAYSLDKRLLGTWVTPAGSIIYYDPVATRHEVVGEDVTVAATDNQVYTLRYQHSGLELLGSVITAEGVAAPAIVNGKLYFSYPQIAKIAIYTWVTDHWQKEADKVMPNPVLFPVSVGASGMLYAVTATQLLGINSATGAIASGFPVVLSGMPIDSPVIGEMDETQSGEEVAVSFANGKRALFTASGLAIDKEVQQRSFVDSQLEVYDTANKGLIGAVRDTAVRIVQIGKQLIASIWSQVKTLASLISGGGGDGGTTFVLQKILDLSFDEGAGFTAQDGAKRKIANITQALWTTEGKRGKALDFEEDTKSYVTIPGDKEFHAGAKGFTWSAWIKPESLIHNHQIIYDADTNGCEDIGLSVTAFGEVVFAVDGTGCGQQGIGLIKTTPGTVENNKWSYVIGVADYQNKSTFVYVNGRLAGSDSIVGITPIDRTMLVSVGRLWDGKSDGQYFDGLIDEVKIYNYAVTPEESITMSRDIVGWWSGEEDGDTVKDSSGHSRNGTVSFVTRTNNGWKGKGFELRKDARAYISVPGQSAFHNGPQGYSWSAWVKLASLGDYQIISDADTNGCEDLNLYITSKSEVVFGVDGLGCSQQGIGLASTPAGTIELGKWYHIVGVADFAKESVSVYVNGALKASDTMSGINPITRPMKFSIGRWADGNKDGRYFDGTIDEVALYNYPLSLQEIGELSKGILLAWLVDDEPINRTQATDSTGHGFTGLLMGATVTESGRFGRAFDFEEDGQQYISLPKEPMFHNSAKGYTWSAWVKPESLIHNHQIITDADTAGCEDLQLYVSQLGEVVFGVDGVGCAQQGIGTIKTSAKLVEIGKWTHISGVADYEKQQSFVYINGVLAGSKTMAGIVPISRGMNINIARAYDGSRAGAYFDGLIDEIKIYPYALTSAEVSKDIAMIVGYWDMDSPSGTTLPDGGRSNHAGIISGAISVAGKNNNGLDFEADASQYVSIQNGDTQFQGSALGFSWAGWIKLESARRHTIISDADANGCEDISLYVTNLGELGFSLDGAGCGQQGFAKLSTAVGSVPIGVWQHVAVVADYQQSSISLYLNGAMAVSKSISDFTPIARPMLVSLGRWWDGNSGWGYFDGIMDEVMMFNYPISPSAVAFLQLVPVPPSSETRCIMLAVKMRNVFTGEIRDTGTPCFVPYGWESIP